MVSEEEKMYLGFDFSTQQLKAFVVDDNLRVLFEEFVEFDSALPEFRTQKGIIQSKDKSITSPTIMWVKAVDILLDKLQIIGADLGKVVAISGSAQQHGTVYWQKGSEAVMQSLDPSSFLHTQLASCFTVPNSPIWMDSSTTEYCRKLESAVGGSEELAKITGSVAYERFSGPQIAKIAHTKKIAYDNTERISLVSSFGASLFLGKYAPIDFSDGSGMNLLDIRKKCWNSKCLEACAPNLCGKLGKLVPSDEVLGYINPYYVERFAFNPNCRVVSFTGDNPASLIGMCLKSNEIAVSLGTSDTIFMWLEDAKLLTEGHILINPLQPDNYMAMLCFKNGSLIREKIRNSMADRSWEEFSKLLERTPRGNFGNMGLFYDEIEIIPRISGEFRFDKMDNPVKKFSSAETEIRALIEGQFVAKRAHAEELGFHIDSVSKILATGGASNNKAIVQVLADVFNTPVYTLKEANSASLGGAYLAKQGIRDREKHSDPVLYFQEITSKVSLPTLFCTPYNDSKEIYTPMVARYKKLIKTISNDN
ncbi:hypothetical protein PGB90_000142 [Kerria lacca]